ncbi:MAG: helix-turn-helix transcriptional regulator [Acidovorax sp.]|jgi:AraC-like DNA-binding protein|nr:helix-turn-helix transcriptional regulator [Acidovorax sp.]
MGFASPERGGHALDLQQAESSALAVTGVVQRYPAGHVVPMHHHRRGHLLYALEGVLLVEADSGQWLLPPTAAVWLRPGVAHSLTATAPVCVHGIFVDQALVAALPAQDCVLHISPLARELIAALVQLPHHPPHAPRDALLGALLVEELKAVSPLPFYLPWPEDAQMRELCQALVQAPQEQSSAEDWAQRLAMSSKTLQRRFLKSTGMNLGQWRQKMRLMASVELLLQGRPITQAALESGYESHSAYSVAFKKQFGCSPSGFVGMGRGN